MPKKLKFGPDEGINYDQPPAYFGGFTILTYGNYGGAGYTAGEYGSASGSTVREFVPANFVANVNAKGRGYQDDIDLVPGNIYNYTATVSVPTMDAGFDAFVGRSLPASTPYSILLTGYQAFGNDEGYTTFNTNYVAGKNSPDIDEVGPGNPTPFRVNLTGSFINNETLNGGDNAPVPLLANVAQGARLTSLSITGEGGLAPDPEQYHAVQPIDPLDALFKTHDMAFDPRLPGFDASALTEANVALIKGISRIPNGKRDADAAIYGGLAALAAIAQVELGPEAELLSDQQVVRYAAGALKDIQRGLNDLSPAELAVAAPLVTTYLKSILSGLVQPETPDATGLSPLDFLNAARWTYDHTSENEPPRPPPPAPFIFIDDAYDRDAGFYGAALGVDGPGQADQIVIAFEGTDPTRATVTTDPIFLAAQLEADALIYLGQIPEAFTDALAFSKEVLEAAEAQGIPRENVFVTGHSLGAAEAEYVAAQLDLGGATFGAPGIHASVIPEGSTPDLVNYVVRGDPFGNYSADPPNRLSNLLYSDDILHFGEVVYIGSPVGGLQLDTANVLLAPNSTDAEKLAGFGLLVDAVKYHHPQVYQDSLASLAGAETLANSLFGNLNIGSVAELWA
jgi:hypothetical protein